VRVPPLFKGAPRAVPDRNSCMCRAWLCRNDRFWRFWGCRQEERYCIRRAWLWGRCRQPNVVCLHPVGLVGPETRTKRTLNALTPQDCTTTPTRLGITPRRCSTNSLGKTIPATIQHCAERPVSASWHCAAYFCTANTSSPRRGDGGTLEWGRMLFL
jgi:hypothetical protein